MKPMEHSAGVFVYRREGSDLLFLLLRKPNGEYDLPKGHLDPVKCNGKTVMETPLQAAIRETDEETGLKVTPDRFFMESVFYSFRKGGKSVFKQLDLFIAETDTDKVMLSDEHVDSEWLRYDDAIKAMRYRDLTELMPVVKDYIAKRAMLDELNKRYSQICSGVEGWDLSTRLVPGEGRADAKIMLIGQAPGETEDETLRPFVGRSGRVLDSMLRKAKIRREDTYITSVVQFFPPENRMPTDEEVRLCAPFLQKQIEIISPKYVILLGNLAADAILGMDGVTENHGMTMEKDGITYMLTFHPAAALRFPKRTAPLMEQDFRKFADIMKDLRHSA